MYLVGSGLIPKENPNILVIWSIFCAIRLILLRVKMTSNPSENNGPQNIAILISLVSYIIWIYKIGCPFAAFDNYNLHVPYIGSLLVIAWSFVIPFIYKGDS